MGIPPYPMYACLTGCPTLSPPPVAQSIFSGQDCLYCYPLGANVMQILQNILSGNFVGALQQTGAIPNNGIDCTSGMCQVNPIMDATDAAATDTYTTCNQKALATAAPDIQAMTTPPSKYDIAGGGILAILAKLAKINPWSIAIGAGTIFRKNIGGALWTVWDYNTTFDGCMAANGTPLPETPY